MDILVQQMVYFGSMKISVFFSYYVLLVDQILLEIMNGFILCAYTRTVFLLFSVIGFVFGDWSLELFNLELSFYNLL